jgi:exoribonuclease-2
MLSRGLLPDFPPEALAELAGLRSDTGGKAPDLTALPWASIDNDDTRDLDQLTVAQALPGGAVRILVAVADVGGTVKPGTALDAHANHNATSVYTAAALFPMLPGELSTGLTSLNAGEERLAIVVAMDLGPDGSIQASDLHLARVRNQAKLAYDSIAAWLEGAGALPDAAAAVGGLDANLRLQDEAAQRLRKFRHEHGALTLETTEAKPVFEGEQVHGMALEAGNRAKAIIEDFMIVANGVTARFQSDRGFPSLRRVVRVPKRWNRIVDLAAQAGCALPAEPDANALEAFLLQRKAAEPQRFAELSLSVVKLLGPGEYVALPPGGLSPGHFGLAMKDYTHSTAPNRRYTDLVTQRLVKAALASLPCPLTFEELEALARHCTLAEDAAAKVERQVAKSAAALFLARRVGEAFDAVVTGASSKGTYVRLLQAHVEGRLVKGFQGLDVGARVRARLVKVDVEQGFIDLEAAGGSPSK